MSGWKVFGSREKRLEDPALLKGLGRFVDDISFPGMLYAAFVRSPHGHATVVTVDKEPALAVPGVHAVYTIDEFRPYLNNDRLVVGLPSPSYKQELDRPVLADGEVVYVGEPIAIVVADTRHVAEDAAAVRRRGRQPDPPSPRSLQTRSQTLQQRRPLQRPLLPAPWTRRARSRAIRAASHALRV